MRFERIVSKDKKSQSWLSANCKVIFSATTVLRLGVERNAGIFVLGEAQRSDAPEAHSCALRKRDEAVTQHSAKRSSFFGEFDPGSGRTLAACLTHASRTGTFISVKVRVANG